MMNKEINSTRTRTQTDTKSTNMSCIYSMCMFLCLSGSSIPSVSKYESASWESTVPYVPDVKEGKVIKVYDGDTITIASFVPGSDILFRFSVRLAGIDTPELKSHDAREKALAKRAQVALSDKIFGRVVRLEDVKLEKYGRLLATVLCDCDGESVSLNMNQWMLDQGHAVAYGGGTKERPANWVTRNMEIDDEL